MVNHLGYGEEINQYLTIEEQQAILMRFVRQKQAEEKRKEYWAKVSEPITTRLTVEKMLDIAVNRGREIAQLESWDKDFVLHSHLLHIWEKLAMYFVGDERCGLNLNKGILLYGNVGASKTTMMRCFSVNPIQSYQVVNTQKIVLEFNNQRRGEDSNDNGIVVAKYSKPQRQQYKFDNYMQEWKGWCFDDIGSEKLGQFYNQKDVNVMEEVFQLAYDNHLMRGAKTHGTTNLTSEQLKIRYDTTGRVYSRLRQMFNLVPFPETAPNLRLI